MKSYRFKRPGVIILRIVFRIYTTVIDAVFTTVNFLKGSGNCVSKIQDPLLLIPAAKIAEKISKGELKSETIVQAYISRIKEIQPQINAVCDERFNDAIIEAKKVDELVQGGSKSQKELLEEFPLLGVPVSLKNSVSIKGMCLSLGLVARKDKKAEVDCEVVANLRKSGAIPLAVTNVPGYLLTWECYNNVHGLTKNPHNSKWTAGGSSGGEGALISAAGSVIGIGTDLAGSVRLPALFNGIFAHKPSAGILSEHEIYPKTITYIKDLATCGVMSRYACDLKTTLKVAAGNNASKLKLEADVDLRKIKVYYMLDEGGFPFMRKQDKCVEDQVKMVLDYFWATYNIRPQKLHFPEMSHILPAWAAGLFNRLNKDFSICRDMTDGKYTMNPLIELGKWFIGQSEFVLINIAQCFVEFVGLVPYFKKGVRSIKKMQKVQKSLSNLLEDNGILILPSHPRNGFTHYESICFPGDVAYTALANYTGFPATQVPLGLAKNGMPAGIQIMANFNNDHLCLAAASQLEKAFGGWVTPCKVPE